MDLENNIWTSFWKWSSSQTTWPWWRPLQMQSERSQRWTGLGLKGPFSCYYWTSAWKSALCSPARLLPTVCPSPPPLLPAECSEEQGASLAFFLELWSQCRGGCQRLRKERSQPEPGLCRWGSVAGHWGFLRLVVDEDLNHLMVFSPEHSDWSCLLGTFPLSLPTSEYTFYFWITLLTNLILTTVRKRVLKICSDSIFKVSGSCFYFQTKPILSYVFITQEAKQFTDCIFRGC